MPVHLRVSLIALTVAAWGVLVLSLTPPGDFLDDELLRLARSIATTGSIAMLVVRTLPPADELLRVGKILGRAEAQRELEAENVTQLRPALRVVGERPTE